MRSISIALIAAPWLAWGMLKLFARASSRVRRRFLVVGAVVLVAELVLFGSGVRILDSRVEVVALSIGGALVWFPLLFVAAIRNSILRVAAIGVLVAATLLMSSMGGFFLFLFGDGGTFRLDDDHRATVEVLYGMTKGNTYDVIVQRPWEWCPLLGVDCARDSVHPDSPVAGELRVVPVSSAGRRAASLRDGERELLQVPFD